MKHLLEVLLIAALMAAGANAQDPLLRMFFDTSGNAGSDAAPHPGSGTLSYDNPVLPPGGGRLYIYAEFQDDEQTVLFANYETTVDGGIITQAWNYNGPGQDLLLNRRRWNNAAPNPSVNPGGNYVSFTSFVGTDWLGLENGPFHDRYDVQHDSTRNFGETLLGFVDVEATGEASVWITVGHPGFAVLGGAPDTPIAFGYGDASVRADAVGVRTQIAEATIRFPCKPCDMDCSGEINAFDIEPFLDLLFDPKQKATPCDTCTGDVNGDGNIDAFDIEPFLECLFP